MVTKEILCKARDGDRDANNYLFDLLTKPKDGVDKVEVIYVRYRRSIPDLILDDVLAFVGETYVQVIQKTWWSRDDRDETKFNDFVWSFVIKRLNNYYSRKVVRDKGRFLSLSETFDSGEPVLNLDSHTWVPSNVIEVLDVSMRITKLFKALKEQGQERYLVVLDGLLNSGLTIKEISSITGVSDTMVGKDLRKINVFAEKLFSG